MTPQPSPSPPVATPTPRRTRRRLVRVGLQIGVLTAVAVLLVRPQLVGQGRSLGQLFDVDSSWIFVALAAELGSLTLYSLTTRCVVMPVQRLPVSRVLQIDLSSIALGHCMPDGGAAGTALGWRLLVASGVPSAQAAGAKLLQGLGSTVVLQLLLLTGYVSGTFSSGATHWIILPAVVSLAILVLIAGLTAGLRTRLVRRATLRLGRRIPMIGGRAAGALDQWYAGQRLTMLDGVALAKAAACSAGNWSLDAFALWASLHAYGHPVGIGALSIAFGIANTAAWIPISPSGLGLSEGLMIPALIALGTTHSAALLGVLTWRLLSFWLPMPLGAASYALLMWRRRSAPEASRA